MTVYDLNPTPFIPSRLELRLMLRTPAVLVSAMLCVTVVILAFVAAMTFLLYKGKSTEALAVGVVIPIVGVLVHTSTKVATLVKQTNGTQSKMVDAIIAAPSQDK